MFHTTHFAVPLAIALRTIVLGMHQIFGLIAKRRPLENILKSISPPAVLCPLEMDFAFAPWGAVDRDLSVSPPPFSACERLSNQLLNALLLQSLTTKSPIAFIETDYHGGAGSQGAVVVECGCIAAGPWTVEWRGTEWYGPINRALQFLGVPRSAQDDEFDVLGLGRWRTNEDWEFHATMDEPL